MEQKSSQNKASHGTKELPKQNVLRDKKSSQNKTVHGTKKLPKQSVPWDKFSQNKTSYGTEKLPKPKNSIDKCILRFIKKTMFMAPSSDLASDPLRTGEYTNTVEGASNFDKSMDVKMAVMYL
jgi:hypothetical protein